MKKFLLALILGLTLIPSTAHATTRPDVLAVSHE